MQLGFCEKHKRSYSKNIDRIYCLSEARWKEKGVTPKWCEQHHIPYLNSCKECRNPSRYRQEWLSTEKEISDRAKLYTETINKDMAAHVNEKCTSCNKPIDFDEWFCYCSLCPDCFLKSDDEIDNYLGEKKVG